MAYYIRKKDLEKVKTLVSQLEGKKQVIFKSSDAKYLQYILRQARGLNLLPEGDWIFKIVDRETLKAYNASTSLALVEDTFTYEEELATVEQLAQLLSNTPYNQIVLTNITLSEQEILSIIKDNYEYSYDVVFNHLVLNRK